MPHGVCNILTFPWVLIPQSLFLDSIRWCVETNFLNVFHWGRAYFIHACIYSDSKIIETCVCVYYYFVFVLFTLIYLIFVLYLLFKWPVWVIRQARLVFLLCCAIFFLPLISHLSVDFGIFCMCLSSDMVIVFA